MFNCTDKIHKASLNSKWSLISSEPVGVNIVRNDDDNYLIEPPMTFQFKLKHMNLHVTELTPAISHLSDQTTDVQAWSFAVLQ